MGGQAQVVTFVLDALLALDENLNSVVVLHLASAAPRVRRALAQLSQEFAGECYGERTLHFRHIALRMQGVPLPAIRNAAEAEAAWAMGRDLLVEIKRHTPRLHVCIAGGPRLLALTLTSAALLHCDHRDRLWHLYTPPEIIEAARDGAILHLPPDAGVALIPVPLIPWGAYFPALRGLTQPASSPIPWQDPVDPARCDAVWQRLTTRQRDVLDALASGMLPQEAAEHLCISLKTLDSHKTQILAECRIAWALPEDEHLTYHFLREKFTPWLRTLGPQR